MARQTADEMDKLEGVEYVTDVRESLESGVAYVLQCEAHNVQRVRVALLQSEKWSPRDGHRNDVAPEHSYIKVTYHHEHLA